MVTTPDSARSEATALTLDVDDDGIARLVFDRPDSPVNILSEAVMTRLDALLAEVEDGVRLDRIRALIVTSAKPANFIAGADVDEIAAIDDPTEAEAAARRGQDVFRRLDRLAVPTIAAIDGTCLGGGTELALACTLRLASDRSKTKIGTPEVRLGIIPGFGGTVRLPRLIGLQNALKLILTGRAVSARKAERMGLVDEVLPAPILEQRARELAEERSTAGAHRAPRRRSLLTRLIDSTPVGRGIVLKIAERRVRGETGGHYPAPLAAIRTLRETLGLPLDDAFRREAEAVGRLVVTDVAKNLLHVFRLMEGAKKALPGAAEGAAQEARPTVERAAVLGAGVMGGGIAQLMAYRGLPVRLKDIRQDAIGEALRHARGLFDEAVRRDKLSRRDAAERMSEISPTLDYTGFGAVDVVVEAVVERMDVKKEVLREVEEHVPESCVLASNTSALSITEMQHALDRPEGFCGMHFFNPVHRMPLVEIVRGAATADETVAAVFAFSLQLGKTPVVVNDGPGFLVNRLLGPYLNEASWLLAHGASIRAVDHALVEFGMPMGPFRLLDEVGLDVARHVSAILYDAFGDRMRPAPPMDVLQRTDRLGRKGGRGFYLYESGKEAEPDSAIYDDLGATVPEERRELPAEEIVDRAVLLMVNEAARALEDGIVDRAGDVDVALITGTGFPPFRGGLLRYADARGADAIVDRLDALQRELGGRFQPTSLLRELASTESGFYARFGATVA